jgi:hypothetical protein
MPWRQLGRVPSFLPFAKGVSDLLTGNTDPYLALVSQQAEADNLTMHIKLPSLGSYANPSNFWTSWGTFIAYRGPLSGNRVL